MSDGKIKILVDCGLVQGSDFCEEKNREPFPYDPAGIDFLFVTHAHIDHIGRIPKLVRDGFKSEIYSTLETKRIAELLLRDALNIMREDAERRGDPTDVLYEERHIAEAMNLWREIDYHEPFQAGPYFVLAKDAGHVLGSAMYEFGRNGRRLVFTGDLGNSPTPLLRDTESIENANYLVMESVYGDRNHEPPEKREAELRRVITETANKKGTLVIPAFSLERTQVILYEINKLVEKKLVPEIRVYVDSPLAIKITSIYKEVGLFYNDRVKKEMADGDDIFNFPNLHLTAEARDSKKILAAPGPKVIIAGAGMSTGGRIQHHERNYLPDPNATILFVGYQTPGSLGRKIQDGAKEVGIYGIPIKVKAKVETISGFSSHKDSDHLIEFVEKTAPTLERVFAVMGEPKSALFLVQRLRDYLGVDAVHPETGQRFELEL